MAVLKARTEFASALNQICAEHNIELEVVLASIKEALLAAYRRDFGMEEEKSYEAEIDPQTGESHLFLVEGKKKKEVTPPGFGRIAAQVAKQVLIQKIREAEKSSILSEYSKRVGLLVNGRIIRFDGPSVIVDLDRAEAVMPRSEQVSAENYKVNQRLVFYIKGIETLEKGEQIIVSRADKNLVEGLFKREVPEVTSGAVKVKEIAREAGNRSKVAVFSTQAGVDPVGSCVGQKGVRVQAVINELNGEKIDIIQYSEDIAKFITAALSPAEKVKVVVDEKKKIAEVSVPEDQLSLAIGKDGQNVRLAVKLTGFKIDIKEAKEEKSKKTKEKKEKKEKQTKKEAKEKESKPVKKTVRKTSTAKKKEAQS
ncbi:transcription termination/antitermination protein NusA [Candidatus Shapirobacteria bacterium]|nr:transcription termination/antitermination protein NusA [Candidatus Shapirobacteria bacterium]